MFEARQKAIEKLRLKLRKSGLLEYFEGLRKEEIEYLLRPETAEEERKEMASHKIEDDFFRDVKRFSQRLALVGAMLFLVWLYYYPTLKMLTPQIIGGIGLVCLFGPLLIMFIGLTILAKRRDKKLSELNIHNSNS